MTADISNAKKEASELLPALREKLGSSAEGVSDSTLLKYLLWKPDVDRAATRFRDHVQWRKDNPFAFDSTPLQASKDDDLRRVLESSVLVAPEGVVAKDGSTIMIGRLRNNDMSDGRSVEDVVRMALYTMDRTLERETTQLHGITIFYDMKDVTKNNIDISIPRTLFRAILGHFPLRISGLYMLNAPFFIRTMFKALSLMFPSKVRARMHFIKDISDVFVFIEQDNLLEEHGGKVKHDQKQWVSDQMKRETDGKMESLQNCVVSAAS